MYRLPAALAPALLLAAAPAAPEPKPDPDVRGPLYPTRVGAARVWEYEGHPAEFTEVVTRAERRGGATVVAVETTAGRRPVSSQELSVSADGLARLSGGRVGYDPPWVLVRGPYRAGTAWPVELVDGHGVRHRSDHVIRGWERVAVPAGRFRALRVDAAHAGGGTATAWYAPGVGLVKQVARGRAGGEDVVVLKAFKPGTD